VVGWDHVGPVGTSWGHVGRTFNRDMVIIMEVERKEILAKITAVIVSELNDKVPWSRVKGLRIGATTGKRGHAYLEKNRIVIPIWILKRSIHYIQYYVCHEIAHLVAFRDHGEREKHGVRFKAIERLFCASFDIRLAFPERFHNRAYPIAICGPDGHFERSS